MVHSIKYINTIFVAFFLMFLGVNSATGQNISINGSITDTNGASIMAANIYFSNEYGGYSDEIGAFNFQIPSILLKNGKSFQIIATFIGFENDTITLLYEGQKKFKLDFSLNHISYLLESIVISDAPIVSYKNNAQFVLDFEFFKDGLAILSKEDNRYLISFQNEAGKIITSKTLPIQAQELKLSCLGDLHAVGELEGCQLHFVFEKWQIVDQYSKEAFNQNILPCKLKTEIGEYVFEHFRNFNQSIYYELYTSNGELLWNHHVYNEAQSKATYDHFRSVLRAYYSAVLNPDEFNVNAGFTVDNVLEEGTWGGDLLDLVVDNNTQEAVSYFKNIVIQPIYAPLFIHRGEVVILDHLNNELHAYALPDLKEIRSIPINYHQAGLFSKKVIQDAGNEKLYAIFFKGQDILLKEINAFNGEVVRSHFLPAKMHHETSFKLKDGFLYYIAQPDINRPLKWVYKQRL